MLLMNVNAWAKYIFLRDYGKSEVSMMAISHIDDPLMIVDVRMPKQLNTTSTTDFTDDGLAEFYAEQLDLGLAPWQFGRIWLHTHPGESARPSSVDRTTFTEVFGSCDWAIMAILASGGKTTCELKYNPTKTCKLKRSVTTQLTMGPDWKTSFNASDRGLWEQEYKDNVIIEVPRAMIPYTGKRGDIPHYDEYGESFYCDSQGNRYYESSNVFVPDEPDEKSIQSSLRRNNKKLRKNQSKQKHKKVARNLLV